MALKPRVRLYLLCSHLALGASIWGYNIGVLSSILIHPGLRTALGQPSPSQRGIITGIYYLGTLFSYLFLAHPLADRAGRRYAALVGTGLLCLGAVTMSAAASVSVMAMGRWVCGLGVGIVSTTVPLYQSEISPAKERGKFVTMNHVGFVAGLAVGLWVGFAMTFWTGPAGEFWGWRVSLLLQLPPAILFGIFLPFIPETPRWLVQKGHTDRARSVLTLLRDDTPETILRELKSIKSVSRQPRQALLRDAALRTRLLRAFLLQFMAQMCGATAMKYYLPTLLEALGLQSRVALMAGAVEMTAKIAMTVLEMWIIDRVGRRVCLMAGCVVMAVAMLVNGALPLAYPDNVNKVADGFCIAFIFIYAMGYSLGLGPAAWVYSSEIFPTSARARGLNLAAAGGSIGSVLVSQIWPIGIARLGSGVYFFFMGVNIVCVPVIWYLYPETSGRALEDMDALFGNTGIERDLNLRRSVDEEGTLSSEGSEGEEGAPLLP